MSISYVDYEVQPLKHFLVKVNGLTDTFLKGELNRLYSPSQLFEETEGLAEEGIIVKAPLSMQDRWPDLVGKRGIFSFLEAHSAIRRDSLFVNGCLFVNPDYMIEVDGRTMGQWIFCERIPLKHSGLIEPTMKLTSFDTTRAAQVSTYDYCLDKGIVAKPNDHLPVGTVVYWGRASYVNQEWQNQNGFLVKYRSLKAIGDEILEWKSLNI